MSMNEIGGKLLENINKEPVFYKAQNNDKPIWVLAAKHNQPLVKRYVKTLIRLDVFKVFKGFKNEKINFSNGA